MDIDLEDSSLERLKMQMTEQQIKDMSEIVQAEVKRRDAMRENNPSNSHMGDVYSEIDGKIRAMREKKLQEKYSLKNAPKQSVKSRTYRPSFGRLKNLSALKNYFFLTVIIAFAAAKVFLLSSNMNATASSIKENSESKLDSVNNETSTTSSERSADSAQSTNSIVASQSQLNVNKINQENTHSANERQILLELDNRRVDLDKRAEILNQKEAEIKNQSNSLAERLAELKSLSVKLSQVRVERDNQYEARLEQLSQVYGSMAPNDAAPLFAKLDEDTALMLLKRMPSKRMGQILSVMDSTRAVDLTRILTSKDRLDDVPAK
ncbi:MAG: hypothetical protein KBC84_02820 [Proteobacteria bacterium]|nr:hypothetical protein [Pseudomonadota bacterium]